MFWLAIPRLYRKDTKFLSKSLLYLLLIEAKHEIISMENPIILHQAEESFDSQLQLVHHLVHHKRFKNGGRRSTIASILKLMGKSIRRTHLMYRANLSHKCKKLILNFCCTLD
jgi:hypothetical protein